MKTRTGLRDVGRQVNLESTFPTPFSALGSPIDRMLASPEIIVSRRSVGPDVGSDHFLVTADLFLRADASALRRC
ncbi:MAG: hypothetical protein FJX78_02510 [Armatimonadetes bacterium]|nr:hypothetical protein [Armatimonadota bacterium]